MGTPLEPLVQQVGVTGQAFGVVQARMYSSKVSGTALNLFLGLVWDEVDDFVFFCRRRITATCGCVLCLMILSVVRRLFDGSVAGGGGGGGGDDA